ncbi:MAG: hypothetical protein IJG24_04885 [Selenomonadaceae bacterium]|nr:hypothetical protein [Selenomonadaceae bacterium]
MNELKELEVDEVSVVSEGANPEAHIVFFKRKEEKSMAKKETAAEVVKQEVATEEVTKVAEPTIDTEKTELQKRVAELEAQLAERDAADKAAVEKAAQEKLAADNAEISAAFERLNKRLEEHIEKAEDAELLKVASRYEILGEDAVQLSATLKKMKAAGVYDEYVGKLDRELVLVEKQGTFSEIGKVGASGYASVNIEKIAKQIQKAEPNLTWRQALDKAFVQNPELQY